MCSCCSGLWCFVPIHRLPARRGDHSSGSARQIGQQLSFSTNGTVTDEEVAPRYPCALIAVELRHLPFRSVPAGGALHRTLRRGAGRVRLEGCTSLDVPYTPQRALAAANKCAPSSRCASFRQRRRQVRLAYPQSPHVARLFYRFIRLAGQSHPSRAYVNMAGCFAKSRSWHDRRASFL
jgi:hypothetical protein